jgi:hypothetical protein
MHVAIRLAALVTLASIGCSSVYWVLYLALPVLAALLISRDGARGYLNRDAPVAIRVLRWLAMAYAYLWLLTDALPTTDARGAAELSIEASGQPTVGTALGRLVSSLPALALLVVMSIVAAVFWIVGAIMILAAERVSPAITDFIAMKLRYQFRLVAYHLSLVEAYPIATDSGQPHAPQTRPG